MVNNTIYLHNVANNGVTSLSTSAGRPQHTGVMVDWSKTPATPANNYQIREQISINKPQTTSWFSHMPSFPQLAQRLRQSFTSSSNSKVGNLGAAIKVPQNSPGGRSAQSIFLPTWKLGFLMLTSLLGVTAKKSESTPVEAFLDLCVFQLPHYDALSLKVMQEDAGYKKTLQLGNLGVLQRLLFLGYEAFGGRDFTNKTCEAQNFNLKQYGIRRDGLYICSLHKESIDNTRENLIVTRQVYRDIFEQTHKLLVELKNLSLGSLIGEDKVHMLKEACKGFADLKTEYERVQLIHTKLLFADLAGKGSLDDSLSGIHLSRFKAAILGVEFLSEFKSLCKKLQFIPSREEILAKHPDFYGLQIANFCPEIEGKTVAEIISFVRGEEVELCADIADLVKAKTSCIKIAEAQSKLFNYLNFMLIFIGLWLAAGFWQYRQRHMQARRR